MSIAMTIIVLVVGVVVYTALRLWASIWNR